MTGRRAGEHPESGPLEALDGPPGRAAGPGEPPRGTGLFRPEPGLSRLAAERDRYREALDWIARASRQSGLRRSSVLSAVHERARAALDQENET